MFLDAVPSPRDHCQIQVLLRILGDSSTSLCQAKLFERIRRVKTINVATSDTTVPTRTVHVKYLAGDYSQEWNAWGELQVHRRVLGLIFVGLVSKPDVDENLLHLEPPPGFVPNNRPSGALSGEPDPGCGDRDSGRFSDVPTGEDHRDRVFRGRGRSSTGDSTDTGSVDNRSRASSAALHPVVPITYEEIKMKYRESWQDYGATLYDCRCFVIGASQKDREEVSLANETLTNGSSPIATKLEKTRSLPRDSAASPAYPPEQVSNKSALLSSKSNSVRKSRRKRSGASEGSSLLSVEKLVTEAAAASLIPSVGEPISTRKPSLTGSVSGISSASSHGKRIGSSSTDFHPKTGATVVHYASVDQSADFEGQLKEYLESLFWVVEGKRLDRSFEKVENLTCPWAPEEQKFHVGLESKSSSKFRKRAIGRLRKQQADYCLLAGLPLLASETYRDCINILKPINDWLWMAAAYEGLACTSILIRYKDELKRPSLQRVHTFSPGDMETATNRTNNGEAGGSLKKGHTRNLSLDSKMQTKDVLDENEILDLFCAALENYQRFSSAVFIELECVFKACRVYIYERCAKELNEFLMFAIEKFLAPDRVNLDIPSRAFISHMLATVFHEAGLHRKAAFFLRITAMYRLGFIQPTVIQGRKQGKLALATAGNQTAVPPAPSPLDYRLIYPMLLHSLEGYDLPLNPRDFSHDRRLGWPSVQIHALQDVYNCALQAGQIHIAIRHLCYLINHLHGALSLGTLEEYCTELHRFCMETPPPTSHIQLADGVMLSPVPFTLIPVVRSFRVQRLPQYLQPNEIEQAAQSVFIYAPHMNRRKESKIRWVCGCASEVLLILHNPVAMELTLESFALLCEDADCEPIPVTICLPASQTIDVRLLAIPKSVGNLVISGYSFELFGVPSICRLRDCPWLSREGISVEVTPPLPLLQIKTTFPRRPDSTPIHPLELANAEASIYAGQCLEGVIVLKNSSAEAITGLSFKTEWMKKEGQQDDGPEPNLVEFIEFTDGLDVSAALPLSPSSSHVIKVQLYGVDSPPRTFHHHSKPNALETTDLKRQPPTVTKRHLNIQFTYTSGDSPGSNFQRYSSLILTLLTKPAVSIQQMTILTGGSADSRYLMLDVLNVSDDLVEVCYEDKKMPLDYEEPCRLPVPFKCCDRVAVDEVRQRMEQSRLSGELGNQRSVFAEINDPWLYACREHLKKQINVRWSMPSANISGSVPVSNRLDSVALAKLMIHPPLFSDLIINSVKQCSNENVYKCKVGELVKCRLEVTNPADSCLRRCEICVMCSMDLPASSVLPDLPSHVMFQGAKNVFIDLIPGDSHSLSFQMVFMSTGTFKLDVLCLFTSETSDALGGSPQSFSLVPTWHFLIGSRCARATLSDWLSMEGNPMENPMISQSGRCFTPL